MQSPSTIRVNAELDNLVAIRRFVEETISSLEIDPDIAYDIVLAVNEIATNTIVHGYQNQHGSIEITVAQQGDSLVVRLLDQAPTFDPAAVPSPDINQPLESRPMGGLGLYLTRQLMDEFKHSVPTQGGNEFTLVKKDIL